MIRIIIFFLFLSSSIFAQTGIGTTTPHASAKLDVSATNKGFLPPRVTLTAATDAVTIPSPAEGLLVYNLGSVGLQAGYYYWNGVNWATIATGTTAGNAVVAGDLVKLYGEVYSVASNKLSNASGFSFTVPVSGRYLFDFSSTTWGGNATTTFKVRQGTTDLGTDFQTSLNNNVHVEYNGKVEVNLQSGITYNVALTTNANRDAGDYDRVYYKMVAGNLPVNQHMAERNFQLNNNFLSNDGDNEGIRVDNSGNVGIGTATPSSRLNIAGGGVRIASGLGNTSTRPSVNTSTIGNYEIKGVGGGASQIDGQDDGFLRLSAGGGTNAFQQSSIDLSGYSASVPDMNNTIVMRTAGAERLRIDNSGNVNMTGKLNVGDPTGNVVTKVSGIINTGSFVQLDNVKAGPTRNGAGGSLAGLSVGAVSTTFVADISATYSNNAAGGITATTVTYTTTASNSFNGWGFAQGNQSTYILNDTTNSRVYRIILMIGASYNNNFISIERLF